MKTIIFLSSLGLLFSVSHLQGVFSDDYFCCFCSFPRIPEFFIATVKLDCPTPQPQVTHGPATRAT